jgi:RNA polymerase sigma factor (sigma-70 family)
MVGDESIDLLNRVRQGDEQAASDLFNRYVERLIRLAQSRLSAKLRRRVDPEDVVQSVYRSFFSHAQDGRYQLQQSGDLWRLLAAITINKVRNQARHGAAGKRAVSAEESTTGNNSIIGIPPEAICREPSSEELNILIEEIESEMSSLSELKRRIVELRFQGHSNEEIAEQVHCTERTVQRTLKQLRERLDKRLLSESIG